MLPSIGSAPRETSASALRTNASLAKLTLELTYCGSRGKLIDGEQNNCQRTCFVRHQAPQGLSIGKFCNAIGSRRRLRRSARRKMKDKAAETECFMWKSQRVRGGAEPDKLLGQPATRRAQQSYRAHSCVLGLPWRERDYSSLGISEARGPRIAILGDASSSCIYGCILWLGLG